MAQAAGQGNTGAYSTGSVFGADADLIRQQIEQQAQQGDVALATAPNLNMGVVLGSQAGRAAGNFVAGATGYVDPRVREANAMQDAAREVDSNGYSLMKDPGEYYKAAYTALTKRGLYDAAGKVHDIMAQQAAATAKAQNESLEAKAAYNNSLKGRYDQGKNGQVIDTAEGTVVNQGTPDPSKAQITIVPKGVTRRGSGEELSFNLSDPVQLADYNSKIGSGKYINVSALPNPTTSISIDNKQDMAALENQYKIIDPVVKKSIENANTGMSVLQNTSAARAFLANQDSDVLQGFASNVLLTGAKAANKLGLVSDDTIANRTGQDAANAILVANIAQDLGGGKQLSTKELQLSQTAGPSALQGREGQMFLYDYMDAKALYSTKANDKYLELLASTEYKNDPLGATRAWETWKMENPLRFNSDMVKRWKSAIQQGKEVSRLPSAQEEILRNKGKLDPTKIYSLDGKPMRVKKDGKMLQHPNGFLYPELEVAK